MESNGHYLFTSESVSEGHPDKLCDQVSDAVLDAVLQQDPYGRVACETFAGTGLVMVGGQITFKGHLDVTKIVRDKLREIGYVREDLGISADSCNVMVALEKQSADIAMGVDTGGAGDQGMMFGFACNETKELMPAPIAFAHDLLRKLSHLRHTKTIGYLGPDAKSQVSVEYEGKTPKRCHTVVISTQHAAGIQQKQIKEDVIEQCIKPVLGNMVDSKTIYHINPTGSFVIGGPYGDTGLTGRKIIVDTYGGMGRHGGGAFSGKDATKVDRSAAYAARYVAKNIVAAGLADRCEVQLSYAIGIAQPTSIFVDTFGTGKISDRKFEQLVRDHFDLTPNGIINSLGLRRPIYQMTAVYGHFGRPEFPWEKADKAESMRDMAKKLA